MSDLPENLRASSFPSKTMKMMEGLDHRRLLFLVLIVSITVYMQTDFWKRPVISDAANWDYFAQVIARGDVPYRDVVNIKSPLSAYISAAAIIVTRPFGVRDVMAIRLTYLLMAAITVSLTFIVAHIYFRSRRIAFLAALIMLSFDLFAASNAAGTQPKTPMVLFGLMTLWAINKDRPFIAGLCGMLSMLSWQPGLLFVGVAVLAFSRHLTKWRDGKALKVIGGAALPLLILVSYFWLAGALKDFYLWCFHYNSTVYGPRETRSPLHIFEKMNRLTQARYRFETVYFYIAATGMLIAMFKEGIRAKTNGIKSLLDAAPFHAMLLAPLIYFAFCLINLQSGPDLFPLLPFAGIFSAFAMVYALDRAAIRVEQSQKRLHPVVFSAGCFILILALIVYQGLADSQAYKVKGVTFQEQEKNVAEIVSHLQPGDKIFVHGQTEVLVIGRLKNASKYFFLDRGKDNYLDKIEPGGFDGWLERLKAEQPKVVALSRLGSVDQAMKLQSLVETDYERRNTTTLHYYLRKRVSTAGK